ncbi:MAG TPA: hypothetical protein VKH19_04140 [Gemmatimonadaceae bacterium]|nr:hypothetical protein [Gemmatimonadaceae bacterium]
MKIVSAALRVGLAIVLLASLSCGDSTIVPESTLQFTLVRIDGKALPTTDITGHMITGGTLTLFTDRRFEEQDTFCIPNSCSGTSTFDGHFRIEGGEAVFTLTASTPEYTASVGPDTLTVGWPQGVYKYLR